MNLWICVGSQMKMDLRTEINSRVKVDSRFEMDRCVQMIYRIRFYSRIIYGIKKHRIE